MYASILKIILFFLLLESAFCAPVSKLLGKRDNYPIGQLSTTPPTPGYGLAHYGDFNNVQLQVNDVNILQFALMLEVRWSMTTVNLD
jgi:hypothetical protein